MAGAAGGTVIRMDIILAQTETDRTPLVGTGDPDRRHLKPDRGGGGEWFCLLPTDFGGAWGCAVLARQWKGSGKW